MPPTATLSNGVVLTAPAGVTITVTDDPGGGGTTPPGGGTTPPGGGGTVPPGAIDFSNQTGQKQYMIPAGPFQLVANNLKPGAGPGDHLGWIKIAPQIGGDTVPGTLSITGSDQPTQAADNIAVSVYFTVGGPSPSYPGAPMYPAGGTCNISGVTNIPIIVDIRMVNY